MDKHLKKRGRPVSAKDKLSAEKILSCAKTLTKQQGKIPSIRALARELNIDAMAIYHYFSNKTTLLEAVTVSLIEEIYLPKINQNWQNELTQLCLSYLKLLIDNNGLLEIFLNMKTYGPAEVFTERIELALNDLEIEPEKLSNFINLLVDFLHGFAYSMNCDSSKTLTADMLLPSLNLLYQLLDQMVE